MLSLVDTNVEQIRRHLTWSGRGNYYRKSTPVLATPLSALGVAQPEPVQSFADLAAIASCREVSPTYGAPFDREKLGNKTTASALLRTLDQSITSPAVDALRAQSTR